MKKISILLAATAMALGLYSCGKGGDANLKDNADSVSYAVGFGSASELLNAIKASIATPPSSGTTSARCRMYRLLCASRATLS